MPTPVKTHLIETSTQVRNWRFSPENLYEIRHEKYRVSIESFYRINLKDCPHAQLELILCLLFLLVVIVVAIPS